MTSTKLYAGIYVVLFAFATLQVFVETVGLSYWVAFGLIIGLSLVKAVLVAGYYQHLRYEPGSVSLVLVSALLTALALTTAAAYSIT